MVECDSEREVHSIGCADSKTFIISFDSFLIAKYFHRQILPPGPQPIAFPLAFCVLVFLFTVAGEKRREGGGELLGRGWGTKKVLSAADLKKYRIFW